MLRSHPPSRVDLGPAVNRLTESIIGSAIAVHRELGPGLLESAYEACLAYEMTSRGISFERQMDLPVSYRGVTIDCGYRLDFLVEEIVILELKAVESIHPVHEAQLLSYLKLADKPLGLIINFNVKLLVDGIKRMVLTSGSSPAPSSS